jgi:hypothetical protein
MVKKELNLKKWWLIISQILALMLILTMPILMQGCGGGSPPPPSPTLVVGYILNQNNTGIEGVKVTLSLNQNSYTTNTDSSGKFSYSDAGIVSGTYQLTAAGGVTGHYVINPVSRNITANTTNNLGNITAYRLIGCGVIINSPYRSSSLSATNSAWKKPGWNDLRYIPNVFTNPVKPANNKLWQKAFPGNLNDYDSCFMILWEPLVGITHYQIHYLGADGTADIIVWDSNNSYAGDPVNYDPVNNVYQAYLDLSDELKTQNITPGSYHFQVVGIGSSSVLPQIIIPIGVTLQSCPASLTASTSQLSWTGVNGANGYRVGIYQDQTLSVQEWVTSSLITNTFIPIPATINSGYHYWCVDAQALDNTGWTAEITRSVSGFTK